MEYPLELLADRAFIANVVVGLLAIAILQIVTFAVRTLSNAVFELQRFSIAGVWIANFESYVPGKLVIEVVHVKQERHRVWLKIQQYSNVTKGARFFKGEGILIGSSLSAIYYATERDNLQNGVLSLSVVQTPVGAACLRGRFAELDIRGGQNRIIVSNNEYVLQRARISAVKRLFLRLGVRIFKDFVAIKRLLLASQAK